MSKITLPPPGRSRNGKIHRNGTGKNGHVQLPPQDREAERAVLGATLRDNDSIPTVSPIVGPAHFYVYAHQQIFQAILDLPEAGELADLVTVADKLKCRGQIIDAGGYAYLMEAYDAAPSPSNAASYARIVRDHARRRQAQHRVAELDTRLHGNEPLDQILPEIETWLVGLRQAIRNRVRSWTRPTPKNWPAPSRTRNYLICPSWHKTVIWLKAGRTWSPAIPAPARRSF